MGGPIIIASQAVDRGQCGLEEWRDVVGYEGVYEVSSGGRVRNAVTGHVLSQYAGSDEYRIVKLFRADKGRNHKVHRLVASAFIRPPREGEQVNHLDLDKANNWVSNLEWCTGEENLQHYIKVIDQQHKALLSAWEKTRPEARERLLADIGAVVNPPAIEPARRAPDVKRVSKRPPTSASFAPGNIPHNRCMDDEDVRAIRDRINNIGHSITSVAREYGVTRKVIRSIARGTTYADI